MNELIGFGLLSITSFFTLINPLGAMPIFMSMTSTLSQKERNRTARKAIVVSLIILLFFAFTGQLLFKFFNISVDSFRVVGGIIFFMMGYDMLQARLGKTKMNETESKDYANDISITPLAIPMLCGPGAITNAIVLMEDAHTLSMKIVFTVSVLLIMLLTYVVLLSSSKLIKLIGETGNKVLLRLMGLIVMVIAVEFFFSGLKPIMQNILFQQ